MRDTLQSQQIDAKALDAIKKFHSSTVDEVKAAISTHKVVVVGMAQNPVVAKARKILDSKGVQYHYLGYGNYFSAWKSRLAIKLWSGWPTFPQIFIDGKLIGGCDSLIEWLKTNKLD